MAARRFCLRNVEYARETPADDHAPIISLIVLLGLGDWREDADAFLAFSDVSAEFVLPSAIPGDVRGIRALERDQERVVE